MKLNSKGIKNAASLIEAGKVDTESSWEFTSADGNAILGDGAWGEYAKWFLAVDETQNEESKAYYKYPFGKKGKVYRSALIAIRQRAGQQGETEIFNEAGRLLAKIDKQEFEAIEMDATTEFGQEKWFPIFWNGNHKNKGIKTEWTASDVERIYEKNKDRRIPIVTKHPEDDLPIVGFVDKLRLVKDKGKAIIEAKLEKISKWFFDLHKKAGLNKVSIALLPEDMATIKHIGLVENPAVIGLPSVEFEYIFSIKEGEEIMEGMSSKQEPNGRDEIDTRVSELELQIKRLQEENAQLKEIEKKAKEAFFENRKLRAKMIGEEIFKELPPVLKEKGQVVLEAFVLNENYEFENDSTFKALLEFIAAIPRVNLNQKFDPIPEDSRVEKIRKKVEEYNKLMRR